MAGGAYNLVQVSVLARFNGKRDQLKGQFILVVWENKTWLILGGREETGIPKIYADIEDLHIIQPNYYTSASYEGNTFLRLELLGAKPVDRQTLAQIQVSAATINALGWRYIPRVGALGADLSQPILLSPGCRNPQCLGRQRNCQMDPVKLEAKSGAVAYHQGACGTAHDRNSSCHHDERGRHFKT